MSQKRAARGDHPEHIATDIGADFFLPCPVDGKNFLARVRALLHAEGLLNDYGRNPI